MKRIALSLSLAALALSATGFASESKISPELKAQLRVEGETMVLVYFEDQVDAKAVSQGDQESVIRTLQENLERTKHIIYSEMGFSKDEKVRSENWINNSISMTVDASDVQDIARHPAVKKVLWDSPVFPAQAIEAQDDRAPEGNYTYGLKKLGVDRVREVFGLTGQGVRIGNIDTGADGNHPDIAGKISLYKDFSGESDTPTDTHGHGTHTVGTMVGGDASGKSIGVAPDAEILVARGIAGSSTLTNLLKSMAWMIDPDGDPSTDDAPVVVSMSWHSGSGNQEPFYEAIANMEAAGVIPNFSAGNSGERGLTHPKEFPGTFTTAATDSADNIASFSSRGPAKYKGVEQKKPEWACPGVDVYSAKNGGGYTKMSGTSMAAPHGAGVIALLFQAEPSLTIPQVREILSTTADDLGPEGWDRAFGMGRLNAFNAVSLVAKGGKISGTVAAADGSVPAGAKIKVVEREFSVAVKNDGSYGLRLPEGSYTLEISAFGYLTQSHSVTIQVDDDLSQDFSLAAAETHTLAGTLQGEGSGVSGKVTVVGTPLAPVETDADGSFSVQLPAGTYNLQAFAFGYEIGTQEVSVPGDSVTFSLAKLPPVLVIDDDKNKDYEKFYKAALEAAGVEYNLVDRASLSLEEDTLLPYEKVVWFTGNASSDTLNNDDQARLKAYLENGGKLFVSGQDLGYNLKNADFFKNVLKAKYLKDKSGSHAVSGLGVSFEIQGGDGANNQKYPDLIEALDGAEAIFSYGADVGTAGIKVGNSVVYLGFGFEAISTAAARAEVMAKSFAALDGVSEDVDVSSQALRNQDRSEAFRQLFE